MEEEEMDHTYFVSINRELCLIEEHAKWAYQVLDELQLYKMEFRFLERFFGLVANKDNEDAIMNKESTTNCYVKDRFRRIWVKEGKELSARFSQGSNENISGWKSMTRRWKLQLDESKLVVKKWCKSVLSSSMKSKPDEILILIDTIVNNLKDLRSYKASKSAPVNDHYETLEERLLLMQNFWKLITRCMHNFDYQEIRRRAHISINNVACQTFLMWVKGANEDDAIETDLIITKILFMTKNCMPNAMALNYSTLRDDYFRYIEATTSDDIIRYIDEILISLKHIVNYKASEISPWMMKQIESLEQKLAFLQNFLKLTANCKDSLDFQKIKNFVCELSKNAAWLTILYYIKAGDEEIFSEMSHMLSDILQKMERCTPDVIAIYFGTLKGMKWQRSDTHLLGQAVVDFVDFLFENIVSAPLKDDFQILHEGLIFVLTFLADPPIENANDDKLRLVLKQIDGLLKGVMHRRSYDMEKDSCDGNLHISQREIEKVTDGIRQFYCELQYSSSYNFPKIIGQRFLDFLIRHLGNLKENHIKDANYLPFAKKTILKIEEEVVSLRSLFNDIMDMQKNQTEISDTRLQVINLAYLTEHVVHSCLVLEFPIWYHMAHLHDVLNRIKVVNTKLEKIKECGVYNVGVLPCLTTSSSIVSKQTGATYINLVVVGFEEEASAIINQLLWGHESLDIVSIVGMAGLGKTTLAKKVYSAPSVKSHFHVFAFCSISRNHDSKRLLHDILSNIIVIDDVSSMTKDDLAHLLWKHLSGRKYLIVLDDIWDIRAWKEVKSAFPNNENGSRVLFTTRFNNVAMEAQLKCIPYHLGLLSHEKSWELLQKKVHIDEIYTPEYFDVGKLIAKKCKGLPLAVVVIAGLLARTKPSLGWWNEIADRIGSFLFNEGCMDMLEFSYKYLPEYLKPMLLYFGAFPEDALISVKSLMLIWIAEGFVHESKTKRLEDVAKDYLHDLVDRSLIMVTGTSSNGGVKTVGIHDLVHEFCRIKARDENFFQRRFGIASSSSSHNPAYNHYRICMQMDDETSVDAAPTFLFVHSLLSFHGCNDPYDTLSIIGKFKFVQVLNLDNKWLEQNDIDHMTLLVHLRHIVALVKHSGSDDILVPSSISNLWTLETFILRAMSKGDIQLPKTIWNLKWLKHVNISRCKLIFPSGQHEHESYSQLNNVESFSSLTLTTGNDLEDLLQRLPGIRKLSCSFDKSCDFGDKQVETLDFLGQLETLNLSYIGYRSPYVIKFASTLKKLKLVGFKLPWTAISVIEKLEHLEILKLLWNSFVGPRWEMEDVIFPSLKFLKLNSLNLVHWKALPDSFPCLEQLLVLGCEDLVEIPACFGEISSLKRFEVHDCNKKALISATQVKNDQMDYGNDTLEVAITNSY